MYKYDVKEIVSLYVSAQNNITSCHRWITDHYDNKESDIIRNMHTQALYYNQGLSDAYERIIKSFFMVSDANFDTFIKLTILGGKNENL